MIPKKETIERLSNLLALPFTGVEQDWEIEMADANRVEEFLQIYKDSGLPNDMKLPLMSLILASYDDFLNEKGINHDDTWRKIKSELNARKGDFSELIDYWSLGNEIENIFMITPLIRELR